MFERSRGGERALLLLPYRRDFDEADAVLEFRELAASAGATVVAELPSRLTRPNPATLIGSGKLEEARALCDATDVALVLVDHLLSPVQERNLEKALERRVVDRTGLILDIFAQRARSHAGKLQVELAQLKHMSTRLVRGWTHLERQRGGAIGLRGPGETQLETDRRLLSRRVDLLRERLRKIEVQDGQKRRARARSELPSVALVGYTNAGKSTLFNKLAASDSYVADQLFATLDPTIRRIDGLGCGPVLLSDTVGFVRDLPHDLIEAFRSTLSEAREADLLLHVVDASDPEAFARIEQVNAVLDSIGAGDLPQLCVFNKADLVDHAPPIDGARSGLMVSALTGEGVPALREALSDRLAGARIRESLRLGHGDAALRAQLFEAGAVVSESADEEGWAVEIDMPRHAAVRLLGSRLSGDLETVGSEPANH